MNEAIDPLYNPWHPITNTVDLKHMGKLIEELNECSSAAARCIIQGIDQTEPTTSKVNRKWLEDEIADVLANINLVVDRFALNIDTKRVTGKMHRLKQWHEM